MKRLYGLLGILLIVILSGCVTTSSDEKTDEMIPINLSTRVDGNDFQNGDKIGLYVTNYVNNSFPELLQKGNYADNVKLTYDGQWVPERQLYWFDDTVKSDFYLYYPYQSNIAPINSFSFSVAEDQTTDANYRNSDFMWGKATKIAPTSQSISINCNHILSSILLKLEAGDGMTDDALSSSNISVEIKNVRTNAVIDMSDGSVSVSGNVESIIPYKIGNQYKAIIIPQTTNIMISLIINGTSFSLNKNLTLNSGSQYQYSIKVSKLTQGLNIGINGWNIISDSSIPDGFVFVKGGTFNMGSNESEAYSNEKPIHQVTLSDFYIGKYEVTQGLWKQIMGSVPGEYKGENYPVEQVSWIDCVNFCNKLSEYYGYSRCYSVYGNAVTLLNNGKGGIRLSTEAEWEYAAKGGMKSMGYKYAGSDNIADVGWYYYNSNGKTHTVGSKNPNELGLYDMSGNVEEWCWDWNSTYPSNSIINPIGAQSGSYRISRGGDYGDAARECRSACRDDEIRAHLGVRLVLIP